eukprot:m.113421 g.113421  ORF g.113421 m.113421 type:complete len:113 (+) comp9420_c0_seq11:521-859(+)
MALCVFELADDGSARNLLMAQDTLAQPRQGSILPAFTLDSSALRVSSAKEALSLVGQALAIRTRIPAASESQRSKRQGGDSGYRHFAVVLHLLDEKQGTHTESAPNSQMSNA